MHSPTDQPLKLKSKFTSEEVKINLKVNTQYYRKYIKIAI